MKRGWGWSLAILLLLAACGDVEETAVIDDVEETAVIDELEETAVIEELEETAVTEELDENGCYADELYDPVEDVCYILCDEDDDCGDFDTEEDMTAASSADTEPGAEKPEPDLELEEVPEVEMETEAEASYTADAGAVDGEIQPAVIYEVDEDLELTMLEMADEAAGDPDQYEETWAVIRDILPPEILVEEVYEFRIFSDGPDETLAYVEPLPDNPEFWMIAVDTADVEIVNGSLSEDVLHTIVHEFAHILTLEGSQVPPGDDSSCDTFFTGEGCALPDSYINQFYYAFWDDIFDELLEIENMEDQVAYEEALAGFYETYADRFVTDYAATNPGEDIADSFALFVLEDEPTGNLIADEKVRFFYNYPEMVAIRDYINGQLVTE